MVTTLPSVSVIIPAFNAGNVLADALASVSSQTFRNLEIVVVDDGSSDDTYKIIAEWERQDSRFKAVRHQSNLGLPSARNTAIHHASGEWLAFLDADDVWAPTKIERQVELFLKDPKANIVFANAWIWNGKENVDKRYSQLRKFPEGDVSNQLIYSNQYCISSVVIKRQTLDATGLFDPELLAGEDWDLWLRIAESGLWARGVWEPLLRYRIWAGNMSAHRVKMAEYDVRVLEKAVNRNQLPNWLRRYYRALQIARCKLELAHARQLLDSHPGKVPATILRAWRLYPRQFKWLLRWLFCVWPPTLGGRFTSACVHRKLREKF